MDLKKFKKLVKEKKESLTRRDIFESERYKELAQSETDAITFGLDAHIDEYDYYDSSDPITAYSTGGEITLNLGTALLEEEKELDKAMLMATGLRAHECGHELFTDGPTWIKYFQSLTNDFENIKEGKNHLWNANDKSKLKKVFSDLEKNPVKINAFAKIAKSLQNMFEDAFVNNGIYSLHAGDPSIGLRMLNDSNFNSVVSFEEFIKDIALGYKDMLSFAMTYLHCEACGYPIKEDGKKLSSKEEKVKKTFVSFLDSIKEARERLPWESDSIKRCNLLTNVLISLYDFLPNIENSKGKGDDEGEEDKKSSSGSGGSDSKESSDSDSKKPSDSKKSSDTGSTSKSKKPGSSPKTVTKEQLEEIVEQITEENKKTSDCSKTGRPSAIINFSVDEVKAEIKKAGERNSKKMEKAISEIAEEKAIEEIEEEHAETLQKEADIINNKMENKLIVNYKRGEINKEQAKKDLKEIKKDAYFLQRRLATILKDREADELERGFYSGSKIFAKDYLKPQKKLFARHNSPTGKPNIRICVLVDESGSMGCQFDSGATRSDFARQKAILLHTVLKNLGVCHQIVGHTDYRFDSLDLYNYVDYDTIDSNDVYRLGSITDREGNRDGAAITHCCEKLLMYPEQKKVLIVISDGEPTEYGYISKNPLIDTIESVKKYSKKGLEIIGAVMVPTNENFEQIYGKNLLDCSTPDKFNKTLIKLIQKYVLR